MNYIHICFHNKDFLNKSKNLWEQLNPDYTVNIYDDNECKEFLLSNYGEKHVKIFDYIPNGSIKADFWRVCILYKLGGVYADVDIVPKTPIKDFWDEDIDFLSVYVNSGWGGKPLRYILNPHFFICKPGFYILKLAIDMYLNLYEKRSYEFFSWSIPTILTQIIQDEGIKLVKDVNDYFNKGLKYRFLSETIESTFNVKAVFNDIVCFKNRSEEYDRIKKTFSREVDSKLIYYKVKQANKRFFKR